MRFYGSAPNYVRHLENVAALFDAEVSTGVHRPPHGEPVVIAGASDLDHVPRRTPVALLEHGAGQRYVGLDHRSWSGGQGRGAVGLFMCPRTETAEVNAARYPDAQVAVVGCPALDGVLRASQPNPVPVVAFTFHPPYPASRAIPELRTALDFYLDAMGEIVGKLKAEGFRVVGHRHPRFRTLKNLWRRLDVEFCDDWPALLDVVDVLVADNTSALPEAAAVGAGTVWLNAPWYRRDVHHRGRFWEWPRFGTQADSPQDVVGAVLTELSRSHVETAQDAIRAVYGGVWGDASVRAAAAIRGWAGG